MGAQQESQQGRLIAVTSQNRRSVTAHAGKCCRFWVYVMEGDILTGKSLLELPREQSLHESHGRPHSLDAIDVLISGGMGLGLANRLRASGIEALVTTEIDPDLAVAAYLAGELPQNSVGVEHRSRTHEHCCRGPSASACRDWRGYPNDADHEAGQESPERHRNR